MNKISIKRTRYLRLNVKLLKELWEKIIIMVCYVINRSLSIVLDRKVIKQVWIVIEVDYSKFRIFICPIMSTFQVKKGQSMI